MIQFLLSLLRRKEKREKTRSAEESVKDDYNMNQENLYKILTDDEHNKQTKRIRNIKKKRKKKKRKKEKKRREAKKQRRKMKV